MNINLHQPETETIIKHSLNNSLSSTEKLHKELIKKGFSFLRNYKIDNYSFDFYCPELKIALEIDGYAHEYSDIHNQDAPKKLHIHSLAIIVLRFTDYQILVDIEEIIRALKFQVQLLSRNAYVV
ncbi:endonuclease domain-containing protein [Aquimarina addita]